MTYFSPWIYECKKWIISISLNYNFYGFHRSRIWLTVRKSIFWDLTIKCSFNRPHKIDECHLLPPVSPSLSKTKNVLDNSVTNDHFSPRAEQHSPAPERGK